MGTGVSLVTHDESMNFMFANSSEQKSNYPLVTRELAESHSNDTRLGQLANKEDSTQLVESITILWEDDRLIIPNDLQDCVVAWYHHYLQCPGSKFQILIGIL